MMMLERIPIELLEIFIGTAVAFFGAVALVVYLILKRLEKRDRQQQIAKKLEPEQDTFPPSSVSVNSRFGDKRFDRY